MIIRLKREKVKSTSLASVGYDVASHILEVKFLESDDVYQYQDVPQEIHTSLMAAESKGRYFNKQVRDGGYNFKKIV